MITANRVQSDAQMTPREVAAVFGVSPKTVARWDDAGVLAATRTPGGHRRFDPQAVVELYEYLKVVGEL